VVAQRLHLVRRGAQVLQPADHVLEHRRDLVVVARDPLRLEGMHADPGGRVLAQPPRQAVVVGMDVGDRHPRQVAERGTGCGQPVLEGRPALV
jgi:hypothetical protein